MNDQFEIYTKYNIRILWRKADLRNCMEGRSTHISCNMIFSLCPYKCPGTCRYGPSMPFWNGKLRLFCDSLLL
jgi:hypothetical protein